MASSPLIFTVQRSQPELVLPAVPTPREVKLLSDIDDQQGLRFNLPIIFVFRHKPSMIEKDPIKVLKHALSQTLVYYYPLAGRIREGARGKLMVDCTGEGSEQIIDRPIRLIQVTRFKCGGFMLSISWNHTIGDASGLKQFMDAWAEMARGAYQPSIQPIWRRELLMARNPPHITCTHREYEQIILPPNIMKRFAKELDEMFGSQNHPTMSGSCFVMSTL
ncbi:benzyl alcohol O-benzoyltransferase [Trifolium repens]|nr:benzyl alcohol O-benzoyltransferase [Trifolium repens]